MPTSVTMPQLGESVTEGTVTRWLKNVGDQVAVDEPLLEVSTDKVDTEIPAPAAGVLQSITAGEDEVVEVGAELGVIGEAGEAPAPAQESAPAAPAAAEAPAPAAEAPAATPFAAPVPPTPEPAAAPAAPAPAAASGGAETSVALPALGESVTEGTVTRWLKNVGDRVAVDEPLLEVSTDKVDTEIPSPVAGVLARITVGEDETAQVGGELGVITTGDAAPAAAAPAAAAPAAPAAPAPAAPEPTPAPAAAAPAPAPAAPAPAPAPAPAAPAPAPAAAPAASAGSNGGGSSAYLTPIVRKLAAEKGVDLASITGTGVGGRIRKQDVLAAAGGQSAPAAPAASPFPSPAEAAKPAAAPAPAPPAPAAAPAAKAPAARPSTPVDGGRSEKIPRLRKVIAERMVESLQVAAQLTTVVEVDVTRIANVRERNKKAFEAREGAKLTFLPFFAKAAVEALKSHPVLNASMDLEAGTITYYDAVNLGIAVDTDRGLLVPVIQSASDLNVPGLAKKIADLAARTRESRIGPDELSGGTFTLTNTGSRGALFDTPIINQPQSAILGTGAVVKRPQVVRDEFGAESIAVRSMVYLALTYDHRLVDGAEAARFLSTMKSRLEEANFEAELG